MINKISAVQEQLKKELPALRAGDTVKIHQRIKEADNKERIQVFEGTVIALKHGRGIEGMVTVRATIEGIGVERIFPLHSPLIAKIEIAEPKRARRAKLYYLREKSSREITRKLRSRKLK